MARLVSVCESDEEFEFQRRQVPLEVDNLKMVVQFSDKCVDCEKLCGVKQKDLEIFINKFNSLSKDEVAIALLVSGKDIMSLLSHMVPCVGCRKSVERLFVQLQKSQHPALEPLVITPRGEMSVRHEYLFDPRSLFSLFHVHGSKLHSVVESIPKSKKNKRCNLHSLETHKSKTLGCWLEAWDALSDSCREKVLVVDMNRLLTSVESYLEKHKFCTECKSKVLLAYSILVGDHDSSVEKGYCAALYENLRCCAKERHVHVLNDTEFIAHLLEKAEPEFLGGKRDRHAKTLDIAQEEVLTCLGIHIFERLHHIWQKLRSEEQTWLILFYIGVDALRKSYQVALEEKQGASNLELLCEELEEKEKRQEEKKELKRLKRRQKKAKAQTQICNSVNNNSCSNGVGLEEIPCKCLSVDNDNAEKNNNFHQHLRGNRESCGDANFNSLTLSFQSCDLSLKNCQGCLDGGSSSSRQNRRDRWTDEDSCESCSMQGSNEGSEEGECSGSFTDSVDSCDCDMLRNSPKRTRGQQGSFGCNGSQCNKYPFQAGEQPSLQDLLEELCWDDGGDEDQGISEEEILAFKAKQGEVESKRQKLRQNLRQRFAEFHLSRHVNSM
ncbi:gametogenetin-binding protein 2 [Aplysia californica]|uniref:Gametogenetin-binding protein 2 n=1 Tax=Aplysia californica TaxID=6500 RepID=A0ABM0JVV2_APLCA|nr:gametogenetin-binding protein 2 [Aplysia californica]XP_005102716.1 gametogenetin-binding protein 2 [Aplysia californica]XP_035826777.1 gametogenetin-binding protein 2 [Aplysia californica]